MKKILVSLQDGLTFRFKSRMRSRWINFFFFFFMVFQLYSYSAIHTILNYFVTDFRKRFGTAGFGNDTFHNACVVFHNIMMNHHW